MKFFVISGAPSTGKTTAINNIALWLTSGIITTDFYGNTLPSFSPNSSGTYSDFSIVIVLKGKKVIMVGDGLNDAGALMKSYAGIAVTDDVNFFTPACSGILEGNQLAYLKQYLDYAKAGASIVKASFVISLLYNVIGLSFALTGTLQPVIAAILMPLSTISIVLFTTLSANIVAQRKFGFTL
jgi:hypothetical protein